MTLKRIISEGAQCLIGIAFAAGFLAWLVAGHRSNADTTTTCTNGSSYDCQTGVNGTQRERPRIINVAVNIPVYGADQTYPTAGAGTPTPVVTYTPTLTGGGATPTPRHIVGCTLCANSNNTVVCRMAPAVIAAGVRTGSTASTAQGIELGSTAPQACTRYPALASSNASPDCGYMDIECTTGSGTPKWYVVEEWE